MIKILDGVTKLWYYMVIISGVCVVCGNFASR